MKFTDYIVFFCILFICATSFLFYKTDLNDTGNIMESRYSSYATVACEDAIKTVQTYSDEGVFLTEASRQQAINVYFKSIALSFNAKNTTFEDELPLYVPVICLIDNNGYYINYTATHSDERGYKKISHVLTPLNVWAETINGIENEPTYQVRYFLNNQIEVTNFGTGESKKGAPSDVWEYFKQPECLKFMDLNADPESFYQRKANIITTKTEADIEYYIVQHNDVLEEYGLTYAITIPEIKGEDWARALEGPTIIGFLQGKLVKNGDSMINIYAMAGAELKKTNQWILTNDGYYHRNKQCSVVSEDMIEGYSYSDIKCAQDGYIPCVNCMQ